MSAGALPVGDPLSMARRSVRGEIASKHGESLDTDPVRTVTQHSDEVRGGDLLL